jgi:hypothetical protein
MCESSLSIKSQQHLFYFYFDSLVFRWLFIPWLQKELDAWVERYNNSRKRADRNKILPHGVPNDICAFPERFGALDFKVSSVCVLFNIILRQVMFYNQGEGGARCD